MYWPAFQEISEIVVRDVASEAVILEAQLWSKPPTCAWMCYRNSAIPIVQVHGSPRHSDSFLSQSDSAIYVMLLV